MLLNLSVASLWPLRVHDAAIADLQRTGSGHPSGRDNNNERYGSPHVKWDVTETQGFKGNACAVVDEPSTKSALCPTHIHANQTSEQRGMALSHNSDPSFSSCGRHLALLLHCPLPQWHPSSAAPSLMHPPLSPGHSHCLTAPPAP